jgi:hypothetical protein
MNIKIVQVLGYVPLFCLLLAAGGCVERKLTIVTEPSDAVVWLNDEEIGTTPVTVDFNWYGEYNIRIEKAGYEILNTHQPLKRPANDYFPLDFFAEIWPGKITNACQWDFTLQPFKQASSQELIDKAVEMRQRASQEIGTTAVEMLTETAK